MFSTNSTTSGTRIADMGYAVQVTCPCPGPSSHPDSLPFVRAIAHWADEEQVPYDCAVVLCGCGGTACVGVALQIVLRGVDYASAVGASEVIDSVAREVDFPCRIEVEPETMWSQA